MAKVIIAGGTREDRARLFGAASRANDVVGGKGNILLIVCDNANVHDYLRVAIKMYEHSDFDHVISLVVLGWWTDFEDDVPHEDRVLFPSADDFDYVINLGGEPITDRDITVVDAELLVKLLLEP